MNFFNFIIVSMLLIFTICLFFILGFALGVDRVVKRKNREIERLENELKNKEAAQNGKDT